MTTPATEIVLYAARLLRQIRRELDLPAYVRVLAILDELGPCGITQLAHADNCAQPTMSAQIRQLEHDGFISRAPHPDDARATLISLTATGRAELRDVRRRIGAAVAERLKDYSPEQTALVASMLRSMVSPEADGRDDAD